MSNVRAVRYFVTFVLLVLVYGETGPWTTLLLALMTIANELQAVAAAPTRGPTSTVSSTVTVIWKAAETSSDPACGNTDSQRAKVR